MSSMQAALDELDDATLDLVVALQLEDVAAIKQQDENRQQDSLGDSTVSQIFADELIQYREDRRSQGKDGVPAEESAEGESAEQQKIACVSCEDDVLPKKAWAAQCSQDDLATCSNCSKVTCTMCKAARHEGDCPADAALNQTLQLADAHGWRRCTNCRSIVDLAQGCNYITCTCRHEFCYACGADWQTCECPIWDERNVIAENDNDNPEAAAEEHDQHGGGECEHELWTFVRGRGVCADCNWRSNLFTMVCNQCDLRACRRCMQTRLRARVEVAEHRIEVAVQRVEVVEMPRREEPGEVILRLLGQTRDFFAGGFRW